MAGNHVVEALEALPGDARAGIDMLARTLGVAVDQAAHMHARMPGVLAGPMEESAALKLVLQLQSLGVVALHRPMLDGEVPAMLGGQLPASNDAPSPAPPPPLLVGEPAATRLDAGDLLGDPDEPPLTPVGAAINLAAPPPLRAAPARVPRAPSAAASPRTRPATSNRPPRPRRFSRGLGVRVGLATLLTALAVMAAGFYLLALPWPPSSDAMLVAAGAALLLAWVAGGVAANAVRDVARLRDEALRIADGALTSPVVGDGDDELAEIAGALEHLRVELQARGR